MCELGQYQSLYILQSNNDPRVCYLCVVRRRSVLRGWWSGSLWTVLRSGVRVGASGGGASPGDFTLKWFKVPMCERDLLAEIEYAISLVMFSLVCLI